MLLVFPIGASSLAPVASAGDQKPPNQAGGDARSTIEIKKMQGRASMSWLSFCSRSTSFYRERFRLAGWRSESNLGPTGLAQVPPLTKTDLQKVDRASMAVSRVIP